MNAKCQLLLLIVWFGFASAMNSEKCPANCKCDRKMRLVDCSSSRKHRHLNKIPANIPVDTEILILDHNNISAIYNDDLSHIRHLKTFSAKSCKIVHIDTGSFRNLNELIKMELGLNKLVNFTLSRKLPALSYLNLTKNRIKHYKNISLCQMPLLGTIDLSGNLIKTSALTKDFRCLRNLTTFVLDDNILSKVGDTDFAPLANSSVRNLSMSRCALRFIQKDAFVPIRNVTVLALSYNKLASNLTTFGNSMQALCSLSSLQQLHLVGNQIRNYTAQWFKCIPTLKYLNLQRNKILHLPAEWFEGLRYLEHLNLSGNLIRTIDNTAFKGLRHLKTLTISHNQLLKIPMNIFSSKTNETYLPNIENINFFKNKIQFLNRRNFKGLYNLRWLDVGRNFIKSLDNNAFVGMHSLTHLHLRNNRINQIKKMAFADLRNTLVYLNLQGNRYDGIDEGRVFLKFLPRLTDLFLSDNTITYSASLKSLIPKEMRMSLQRLSMSHMGINKLPIGTFTGMHNLKKLELGDNNIVSWDPKVFGNLSSLTNLWLRNNLIQTFNESSLGDVWYQLSFFRADYNQYACNCDLLWFLNWKKNATKNNVKIPTINPADSYICASPKQMAKKSIFDYKPHNLECTAWWLIVTPSVTGFLVLLLLSTSLGCWYRHHLRLCCFRNFGIGYKDYEIVDGKERDYDAFISYSQDDMEWVTQTLVKTLEGQYGFKVFIEDRDYILGGTIVDNIISGIESSRRVIIVLSHSFLEGQWCGLEVQLIQKKLLKKLIVIKRDDVRDFELSPTLGWIIRERRYIEWKEHPVAQVLFWEQLNHAIEENPDKPRLCAIC